MNRVDKKAKMVKAWKRAKDKWIKFDLDKDYDRVTVLMVDMTREGLNIVRASKRNEREVKGAVRL